MRTEMNNIVYDTEDAILIAKTSKMITTHDGKKEELYLTYSGHYFLYSMHTNNGALAFLFHSIHEPNEHIRRMSLEDISDWAFTSELTRTDLNNIEEVLNSDS